MTEPGRVATEIQRIAPRVWLWHVWDDRIDFESDAHAVGGRRGVVLIDPLPLRPDTLEALGPVEAICLTAGCHQRSAWRYRAELGAPVHAPEGAEGLDEEPDFRYRDGDVLPGRMTAIHTPGPEPDHYAFRRPGPPAVMFCPNLLVREEDGTTEFLPPDFHDDPEATRRSVRRLLDFPFSILCFDHGRPLRGRPQWTLRRLLRQMGGGAEA